MAMNEHDELTHLRMELVRVRREAEESRDAAWAVAEQLAASEVALRASNRAKEDFLEMLGHELRNPLSPILVLLDVMQLTQPAAFPEERAIIGRQVRYLVRLVDDLLGVARRSQGGKVELHRESIELADVVASAVELASPLFDEKAHHVTVNVPPHGLVIDADRSRLSQAVANLLMNAGKFTPHGGRIIVTGAQRESTVSLSVRDSGVGISKELLPSVFDQFVQAEQPPHRPQGGLGLGLAIVSSLVKLHGGTVTARSAGRGRGSEFVIELPTSTGTD